MSRLKHHLWKICKTTLIIALIEFMIAVVPSPVSANVYLGGYFSQSTYYDVDNVILDSTPFYIPPGTIPVGDFLGGVLSVAGVKSGVLSGWIYQIASIRLGNGELRWTAQSWNGGSMYDYHDYTLSTDEAVWAGIYLRMDMDMTYCYENQCWGYKNDKEHLSFCQYVYLGMNNGETSFRVGTSTRGGITYKHFQFGVESKSIITGYPWCYKEYQLGYYCNGYWRYLSAKAANQNDSWITWRGLTGRWKIAHSNYDGVNRLFSGDGNVIWQFTGTTIPNGEWLWTNTGLVPTYPVEPFIIP